MSTISNLSWDIYDEQKKEDQTNMISQNLIHNKDPTMVLKNTYS